MSSFFNSATQQGGENIYQTYGPKQHQSQLNSENCCLFAKADTVDWQLVVDWRLSVGRRMVVGHRMVVGRRMVVGLHNDACGTTHQIP